MTIFAFSPILFDRINWIYMIYYFLGFLMKPRKANPLLGGDS